MPDTRITPLKLPISLRRHSKTPVFKDVTNLPLLKTLATPSDNGENNLHKNKRGIVFSDFSFSENESEYKLVKQTSFTPQEQYPTEQSTEVYPSYDEKKKPSKSFSNSDVISCSLDNGLNYISDLNNAEQNSVTHFSKIPKSCSGSYPDLSKEINSVSDNTMFLLKSWHEYSDSYNHEGNGAEKLNSCQDIVNLDCNSISNSNQEILDKETVSKISNLNSEEGLILEEKSQPENKINEDGNCDEVGKECKLSLKDFGITEDFFLNDVTSRTANLANQNCSFKFTHSKVQAPE